MIAKKWECSLQPFAFESAISIHSARAPSPPSHQFPPYHFPPSLPFGLLEPLPVSASHSPPSFVRRCGRGVIREDLHNQPPSGARELCACQIKLFSNGPLPLTAASPSRSSIQDGLLQKSLPFQRILNCTELPGKRGEENTFSAQSHLLIEATERPPPIRLPSLSLPFSRPSREKVSERRERNFRSAFLLLLSSSFAFHILLTAARVCLFV